MTADNGVLAAWLNSLGLGEYLQAFFDNDIDLEVVPRLSDGDLKELGLSLGHRRVLMAAAGQLQGAPGVPSGSAPLEKLGERRQITVMFCDLVGSTELSTRLDLDDLRSLIHAYYSSCCRIIEEGGGFIARLIGDGILAYFCYPEAREDAAECAIRAGLRILETLGSEQLDGQRQVNVRIGLATGLTVISDMVGSGFSEQHTATGRTPNLAARIQTLALPGTIAVADETRRLAGGIFNYGDLGWHALKGFDEPMRVWRVESEASDNARFDAQRTEIFDCLGRDTEMAVLRQAWEAVQQGHSRIVTIAGEAGIGKSRLVRAVGPALKPANALCVLLQCAPNQTSTPLHPLIAWIRRETGVSADDGRSNRQRLQGWRGGKENPLDLALIADLLHVPVSDVAALPAMPPDRKRSLTREVVLQYFQRHCEHGPVLFMLEDAHWMDGATEDLLRTLFQSLRDQPLLALITTRVRPARPWADNEHCTEIRLEPLGASDAEKIIQNVCHGRQLPPAIVREIIAKTDGVPLFVEELTATVLESGKLRSEGTTLVMDGPLPAMDIPSTLRDSLAARLDRMGEAKEVARIGSALGREFSYALVAHITDRPEWSLKSALGRLVDAQLLFQSGQPPTSEYLFKHALVQQAAYDGQLRDDRQALHARIVQAIETHQPDMASREPGLMAHHCHQAQLADKEAAYLYAAGLASTRLVAIPEALSYFTRAEQVIAGLPQTPSNVARHIDIILGMMEVGRFTILPTRLMELGALARRLSQVEGVNCDAPTIASILFQEGRAQLYSSRYAGARRLFQQIRELGRRTQSPHLDMKPGSAFTMDLCCQGLFNETLDFINETNVGYYKETGNSIDYISGLGWIGYAVCQMGPGDDGVRFGDLSVREAELVNSAIYLGGAHVWRSHALMSVRRLDEAVADALQCAALAPIVPYLGWHALVFLALCECRRGRFDAATQALDQARSLLAHEIKDGQWSLFDYVPAIEAEIACFCGRYGEALAAADRAITVAGEVDGHFAQAIAWRVKAICALREGADALRAQAHFERAVQLFEQGGARAEQTFATLIWAHALQQSGFAEHADRELHRARALADEHGFDLQRCEYGASAML